MLSPSMRPSPTMMSPLMAEFRPVPKPKPKPKKRPKPMKRKSATKRTPPPQPAAAIPKGERIRDPEHVEIIRRQQCVCAEKDLRCGGWQPQQRGPWWKPEDQFSGFGLLIVRSEAAHVTNRGWGGGDNEVIPLCPNHHRLLACSWHVAGRARFQRMFKFDAAKLAAALYDETLRLRGLATP